MKNYKVKPFIFHILVIIIGFLGSAGFFFNETWRLFYGLLLLSGFVIICHNYIFTSRFAFLFCFFGLVKRQFAFLTHGIIKFSLAQQLLNRIIF
jgi:hypothetical protein